MINTLIELQAAVLSQLHVTILSDLENAIRTSVDAQTVTALTANGQTITTSVFSHHTKQWLPLESTFIGPTHLKSGLQRQ